MNYDRRDDLKQFINSHTSQSEDTITNEMRSTIQELRQERLEGFAGAGNAIKEIHDQLDAAKVEFNVRLTKLEQQAA